MYELARFQRENQLLVEAVNDKSREVASLKEMILVLEEEKMRLAEERDHKAEVLTRFLHSSFVRKSESSKFESETSENPLFVALGIFTSDDDSDVEQEQSEGLNQTQNPVEEKKTKAPSKPTKKRGKDKTPRNRSAKIPAHLPIEVRYVGVEHFEQCQCCAQPMNHHLRYEHTQEIAYSGSPYYIIETRRPVRACQDCEKVAKLPVLNKPFERSIFHETFVAHVIAEKIAWGLPIYRQSQRMSLQALTFNEAQLQQVYMAAIPLLDPVLAALKKSVFEDVTILDLTHILGRATSPENLNGKYKRANFFGSLGVRREVYLSYGESMKNDDYAVHYDLLSHPFCSDAAQGFSSLAEAKGVKFAKCGNHARRYIWNARFHDRARVKEAISIYRQLFLIERDIAQLSDADKVVERTSRSAPLCDQLLNWCKQTQFQVSPKSSLGKAIKYIMKHWSELTYFLKDGRMPLHTNDIENIFRIIARGRKAFMHVSSLHGGQTMAGYYSLIISCIIINIDPWLYLTDVLRRVGEHNNPRDLIPRKWKVLFMADAEKRYSSYHRKDLQHGHNNHQPPRFNSSKCTVIETTAAVMQ